MGKYDSPLDPVDQENSVVHGSFSEQKTESWGSWFCRHGLKIVKGSVEIGRAHV